MGKIRKNYTKEIKLKAINLYQKEEMGIRSISKELGIGFTTVQRWIAHYKREGIQGLEEKRGTSRSPLKRRPKKDDESDTETSEELDMGMSNEITEFPDFHTSKDKLEKWRKTPIPGSGSVSYICGGGLTQKGSQIASIIDSFFLSLH